MIKFHVLYLFSKNFINILRICCKDKTNSIYIHLEHLEYDRHRLYFSDIINSDGL